MAAAGGGGEGGGGGGGGGRGRGGGGSGSGCDSRLDSSALAATAEVVEGHDMVEAGGDGAAPAATAALHVQPKVTPELVDARALAEPGRDGVVPAATAALPVLAPAIVTQKLVDGKALAGAGRDAKARGGTDAGERAGEAVAHASLGVVDLEAPGQQATTGRGRRTSISPFWSFVIEVTKATGEQMLLCALCRKELVMGSNRSIKSLVERHIKGALPCSDLSEDDLKRFDHFVEEENTNKGKRKTEPFSSSSAKLARIGDGSDDPPEKFCFGSHSEVGEILDGIEALVSKAVEIVANMKSVDSSSFLRAVSSHSEIMGHITSNATALANIVRSLQEESRIVQQDLIKQQGQAAAVQENVQVIADQQLKVLATQQEMRQSQIHHQEQLEDTQKTFQQDLLNQMAMFTQQSQQFQLNTQAQFVVAQQNLQQELVNQFALFVQQGQQAQQAVFNQLAVQDLMNLPAAYNQEGLMNLNQAMEIQNLPQFQNFGQLGQNAINQDLMNLPAAYNQHGLLNLNQAMEIQNLPQFQNFGQLGLYQGVMGGGNHVQQPFQVPLDAGGLVFPEQNDNNINLIANEVGGMQDAALPGMAGLDNAAAGIQENWVVGDHPVQGNWPQANDQMMVENWYNGQLDESVGSWNGY